MKGQFTVIICGTPGTGKSRLVEELKPHLTGFNFTNLGRFAIENECIESYDDLLDSQVVDEDKLASKLEPLLSEKKINIIESIHADILPTDQVDLVYVCRTTNTILFDRLSARKYKEEKITNNIEAEIFQTIYDEASEIFDGSILIQLENNDVEDLKRNAQTVLGDIKKAIDPGLWPKSGR